MLGTIDSAAIVAVSDMARSKRFYGEALGLEQVSGDEHVIAYKTGKTVLVVYRSAMAGTNKANAVVWGVGDQIDAIATDLIGKGVPFEHYPEMGMDYANGVHTGGSYKGAWFKDPDGNILHINNI